MTELSPQEFANSFDDPADKSAVDFYLDVSGGTKIDEAELLRLAAPAGQKRNASESSQRVEDAIELAASASGAVARLREKLLMCMNFATLMALLSRIGYNLEMLAQDRHITGKLSPSGEPEIDDPVKGPVFAMIQRRFPKLQKASERRKQLDIDAMIKIASERTDIPRPTIPCDLEPALRWAAGDPDVPFKTLRRAFINCLETDVPDGKVDDLNEDLVHFNQQLKDARVDPRRAGELRHEIKVIKDRLAYLRVVKGHKSSFKPGKTDAPKKVAAQVKGVMDVWDRPNSVWDRWILAELSAQFHPFWQKHAAAYQKSAVTKSSVNKTSGKGGPISRMKKTWISRTKAFVEFAKGKELPLKGSDEWNDFFNEFAKTQPEQRLTQKKIAGFMRTLRAHGSVPISDAQLNEVIGLLEDEKIGAVDHETIRSCLKKMGIPTAPSSTKRSRRPNG